MTKLCISISPKELSSWSSLDTEEESLACQITSPYNYKLGCFWNKIKKFAIPALFLLNREVICKANDFSLSKELHAIFQR